MEQALIDATLERVRAALEAGQVDEAITALTTLHPADRADAFADLPRDDQDEILPRLDTQATADLLEELEDPEAASQRYPAAMVHPREGVVWFIDRAAATGEGT